MPNFGGSETGLPQPLLSILEERMYIEEVNAGHTDSLPPPDPSSRQDATLPSEVLSTSASGPDFKPVELHFAAGEEQGILLGDHSAGTDKEDSQYWPCLEP